MRIVWQLLKATMYFVGALVWCTWFVSVFPVMLTSGLFTSLTGIALLALSVIVPAVLVWNKIKGKSTKKETIP